MGYKEEIFERAEFYGFKDIADAQDFLLSFSNQSRKNAFAKEAYQLGKGR